MIFITRFLRSGYKQFSAIGFYLLLLSVPAIIWQQASKSGALAPQDDPVSLFFTPDQASLPPNRYFSVMMDAGSSQIVFASLELSFDPARIVLREEVRTAKLFGYSGATSMDEANTTGRITLFLALTADQVNSPRSGLMEVAQLSMEPASAAPEQAATITFIDNEIQLVNVSYQEVPFTTESVEITVSPQLSLCDSVAGIPLIECEALLAQYQRSEGASWSNWFTTNTPCSDWTGVVCNGGHVTELYLDEKGIEGTIAPELADLTSLELLNLEDNYLVGTIPPQLGQLANLHTLRIEQNRLSGLLPQELGALSALTTFRFSLNAFSDDIPYSFINLASLSDLQLGYNKLTANHSQVASFITDKSPGWAETQTVPPTNLVATTEGETSIRLDWTPVKYTSDDGYYEVYYSTLFGGPYSLHGISSSKSDSGYSVDGLTSGTAYYFRVRTFSQATGGQRNNLWSSYSSRVSAITAGSPPTPTATPTSTPIIVATPTATMTATPTESVTATPSVTETPVPFLERRVFIPFLTR